MLKPRNLIITFLISFVLMAIVAIFMEFSSLERQANSVNTLIPVAAELAIEQSQSIDDAFNSTELGYALGTGGVNNVLELLIDDANLYGLDSNTQFKTVELFPYYYNKSDKKDIYESMFINGNNGSLFRAWAQKAKVVTRKFRAFDATNAWVEVPKLVNMGIDTFQGIQTQVFPQTTDALKVYDQYSLYDYTKSGGAFGSEEFYHTPRNLGMTYINQDMTEFLFLNNLDLIFRSHYASNTRGIADGVGTIDNGMVYQNLHHDDLVRAGVINNGSVLIDRGRLKRDADGKLYFDNTITQAGDSNIEVEYKVIDAYDSTNDEILKEIYGANTGGYSTKAEHIKANDKEIDIEKFYTGAGVDDYVDQRYIIVAKVKFKVKVYVPYTQPIIRTWMDQFGSRYNNATNNLDLNRNTTDNVYEYTTYYAVI